MTETQTRLASDPAMPVAGTVVGDRYEVRDVLGEGGFAVVYRAFDVRTKADVAVKVLDPLMSRRREFASRFMREVETVSRLRHHNTISIFDAGETDQGCLYLVMELLEGLPLDTVLEAEGRLPAERVRRIAVQILKSLQEAHSKGIIHRDLKPANVFIANVAGEADYVKVLDFGIAKSLDDSQDSSLTATGQVMCSPHYVAPERVKDSVTVPASDLYSLGVMMVELLEGKPPYEADSPMMLAVKHLSADPVPLGDITRQVGFASVVERACQKPLTDRYTSALEMLEALQAAPTGVVTTTSLPAGHTVQMDSSPVGSSTSDDVYAMPPRSRAGLYVAIGVAALVIGAAGVGLTSLTSDSGTGTNADNAEQTASVETQAAVAPTALEPVEPMVDPEPPVVAEGDVGGAVGEAGRRIALALRVGEGEQLVSGTQLLAAREAEERARAEEEARAEAERRRNSRTERQRPEPDPEPVQQREVVAEVPTPEPPPRVEPEPEPEPEQEDSSTRTRVIRELAPR